MTNDEQHFWLDLAEKLCEHLDQATEQISHLRQEQAEATRQLARIAEHLQGLTLEQEGTSHQLEAQVQHLANLSESMAVIAVHAN